MLEFKIWNSSRKHNSTIGQQKIWKLLNAVRNNPKTHWQIKQTCKVQCFIRGRAVWRILEVQTKWHCSKMLIFWLQQHITRHLCKIFLNSIQFHLINLLPILTIWWLLQRVSLLFLERMINHRLCFKAILVT